MTSDDIANLIIVLLCMSGPIFFLTTIGLGLLLFNQQKRNKTERQNVIDNMQKIQENLQNEHLHDLKIIRQLEEKISVLSSEALRGLREQWFREITNTSYKNEIEVEIKFIYPLMRFLGYTTDELQTRVSIQIQVGRNVASGIADWVVYHDEKPFVVVEAKEQNQGLANNVQEQARSYAYALGAPFYAITNGKVIQIYKRNIDLDTCELDISVNDMREHWEQISGTIGKGYKQDIKEVL